MSSTTQAPIVVIDNDETMQDLFTLGLAREGWPVFAYTYAGVDLAAIKQHQPSLIILDFNLGGNGLGWKFLKILQADAATVHIPIIVTTTTFELSAEVRDYLLTHYITTIQKPFTFSTFVKLVYKTLTLASQAGAIFSGDPTLPILLVDDTDEVRDTITTVLRLEGYRVVTAYNGLVALDTVSRADYCLILLDIAMPIMNGFEFLSAYNQQPRPHSPAIVVSAEFELQTKSLPSFVVDVLPKPFHLSHLLGLVGKYAEPVPVWG